MVATTPCALSVSKQGEKEENDFCTGGAPGMYSYLVESVAFWYQGAPWYISELGIYQRSSGEMRFPAPRKMTVRGGWPRRGRFGAPFEQRAAT